MKQNIVKLFFSFILNDLLFKLLFKCDFVRIQLFYHCNRETFCTHASYGQSKLAQTMSTITLQRLLKDKSLNILVYSVHPGIVRTDLFKNTYLGNKKWLMAAWKVTIYIKFLEFFQTIIN